MAARDHERHHDKGNRMSDGAGGGLPADGETLVAGVRLPAGRRLGPAGKPRGTAPALWATGPFDEAQAAWLALRDGLRGSGLVPLLLSDLNDGQGRPWESGELRLPGSLEVDNFDAATLLPELWADQMPEPEEEQDMAEVLAPYSRPFPGLAPASTGNASPGQLRAAVESLPGPLRIGLVAAARPADALTALGWGGAVNYVEDPEVISAVLRSWEERFGASLLHVGFDVLDLLVERPVTTAPEVLAVAAEHYAFCPDNVDQGAGSITEYAAELADATRWSFWWD